MRWLRLIKSIGSGDLPNNYHSKNNDKLLRIKKNTNINKSNKNRIVGRNGNKKISNKKVKKYYKIKRFRNKLFFLARVFVKLNDEQNK